MVSSTVIQVLNIVWNIFILIWVSFMNSVKVNVSLIVVNSFLAKSLRYLTINFWCVMYLGIGVLDEASVGKHFSPLFSWIYVS